MRDALILAVKHEFDVFNALDIFQVLTRPLPCVPLPRPFLCLFPRGDTSACSLFALYLLFHRLENLQNESFLKTLKFGIGDGRLQYYIYNWRTAEVKPEEVGLVLL